MSWSFKVAGKPADVKAAVQASEQVPDCVKEAIIQVCDGVSATPDSNHPQINGVSVESFGHYGPTDYWNGVTLKAEGCTIAPTVPVAPIEPPPQPDAGTEQNTTLITADNP